MTEGLQKGENMAIGVVQAGYGNVGYTYSANTSMDTEEFYAGISSAAELTKDNNDSEIIGLTMIPYGNTNMSYGMRAQYAKESTTSNPVVQVTSNYGGKVVSYNVNVNEVNPANASQLEMFALLSYADDQGMTNSSTFGSYQQLKVYANNASLNGYCEDLTGYDTFLSKDFDWVSIMKSMMEDYLETGIYNQYQSCKNLLNFFDKFTSNIEDETEAEVCKVTEESLEMVLNTTKEETETVNETVVEESEDYQKLLEEKIKELIVKIHGGDTENSYQIGARSFTEKEWEEFLEKFDSIQEAIREAMREEQERRQAEQLKQKQEEKTVIEEKSNLLVAESTVCTYPTANPEEEIRYITCYTTQGIFCKKAGETEDTWSITFETEEQYNKVTEFIAQFPEQWNLRFAAHENFWTDFLNDEIDMDGFMEFMEGTNEGVPDYSITVGDSMFVDKEKIQWAKYLNPLGAKFYTAEEFQKQQMELVEKNAEKNGQKFKLV